MLVSLNALTPIRCLLFAIGVLCLGCEPVGGQEEISGNLPNTDPFTVDLSYDGALWGIAEGQSAPTSTWQNQAQLDIGLRLSPPESKARWSAQSSIRWRNSNPLRDPGFLIGSTALFDPSDWGSGTGARLLQLGVALETDSVDLLFGWIQPQQNFLLQPLSKKVLNHAVLSAKGVGGNIPFVSSFSTWGGLVNWRSISSSYLKSGVFMTYPEATETSNHGLWFGGNPGQPGTNSLMGIIESGHRFAFGAKKRPALLAAGIYLYDGKGTPSAPTLNLGTQTGGYLQWDQRLWTDSKVSDRALDLFAVASAAPASNNTYPLYGHIGLALQGPFRHRRKDLLIGTLAASTYSQEAIDTRSTYSVITELGYQLSLDSESIYALYPFAQLVIRPDGSSNRPTAFLAGLSIRVAY